MYAASFCELLCSVEPVERCTHPSIVPETGGIEAVNSHVIKVYTGFMIIAWLGVWSKWQLPDTYVSPDVFARSVLFLFLVFSPAWVIAALSASVS